jgi:hypothetical protein
VNGGEVTAAQARPEKSGAKRSAKNLRMAQARPLSAMSYQR